MPVSSISVISRNTQGVKVMDMETGERVIGAARLAEQEEDEETTSEDAEAEGDVDRDEE
jgi:DNA gyrase subunit A